MSEQDPYSEKTKEEELMVTLLHYLSSEGYKIQRAVLMYTEATAKKAKDTQDDQQMINCQRLVRFIYQPVNVYQTYLNLVAYDIPCNKRCKKVADLLEV